MTWTRSVCGPQGERRYISDKDAISRDHWLRPGCSISDLVPCDRLEARAVVPQHEQFAVVLEREDGVAGADDRGVRGLPRLAFPQHLAGVEVEREVFAAIEM